MKHNFGKIIVISLGGSITFQRQINVRLLRNFINLLKKRAKNKKFVVVIGGGRISRNYLEAIGRLRKLSDKEKDWLGIWATRANAFFLKSIFGKMADPRIIDRRRKIKKLKYPITIASGWTPGRSTDFVALAIAKDLGLQEAIFAGKPAYVYDYACQSNKNKKIPVSARPLKELTWLAYRRLIPQKWLPGAHAPVDPTASRFAAKNKMIGIVINGEDIKNFDNLLLGKEFEGTIIKQKQDKAKRVF